MNNLKSCIAGILFSLPANVAGQGISNLFLLGYDAGLGMTRTNIDFNTGQANIYSAQRLNSFRATNASISDSSGNLLFYTNGIAVFDVSYDTLQNGDSLNPSPFATQWGEYGNPIVQACIIIPKPGDSSAYYLFHETAYNVGFNVLPKELYYSVIDIAANGGLGAVVLKNSMVIQNDTMDSGKTTATRHGNGRDWWVIKHDVLNNKYNIILVTPTGFQFTSQSIGTSRMGALGQAAFSPDGSKYAYYDFLDDLDVMDFDRCAGVFSNLRHVAINDSASSVGVAFSPNSRYLYVSSTSYVYQFDCLDSNFATTKTTVAVWDSFYSPSPPFATTFFLCQNANDGKIYMSCGNGTDYLHKIENPDSAGLSCNVQQHSILLPTYNAFTIPNHPNYFLGALTGSICDSLNTGVTEAIIENNLMLRINPNPASGNFYLNYKLPNNKDAWLYLLDAQGRQVMKRRLYWSTETLKIYSDKLKNGLYHARVVSDEGYAGNTKLLISK